MNPPFFLSVGVGHSEPDTILTEQTPEHTQC